MENLRLDEIARVGFMGNFDVIIYTDDMEFIPHFHVVDKQQKEVNLIAV